VHSVETSSELFLSSKLGSMSGVSLFYDTSMLPTDLFRVHLIVRFSSFGSKGESVCH